MARRKADRAECNYPDRTELLRGLAADGRLLRAWRCGIGPRVGFVAWCVPILSYGLSLIVHTITVVVSWKQLFDPYGFAKVGNHLWISTWPTWGAFIALYLLRSRDVYSIDGWRESRA